MKKIRIRKSKKTKINKKRGIEIKIEKRTN